MKKLIIVSLAFVLAWSFNISQASAGSFMRCNGGRSMVSVGDSMSKVMSKCGSPVSTFNPGSTFTTTSTGTVRKRPYGRDGYRVKVESTSTETPKVQWTYNIKSRYGNKFSSYTLEFEGGILTDVSR